MLPRTTTVPLLTPDLIWVNLLPTVPSVTLVSFGVLLSRTVTSCWEPTVCTAEEGTVVTFTALPTVMASSASDPESVPRFADSNEIVTGYVEVLEPLVASTPMAVTFPGDGVLVESGVTWTCWPTATSPMLVTGTSVVTWYDEPDPMTATCGAPEDDPTVTESPAAIEMKATVPEMVDTRLTSLSAC